MSARPRCAADSPPGFRPDTPDCGPASRSTLGIRNRVALQDALTWLIGRVDGERGRSTATRIRSTIAASTEGDVAKFNRAKPTPSVPNSLPRNSKTFARSRKNAARSAMPNDRQSSHAR